MNGKVPPGSADNVDFDPFDDTLIASFLAHLVVHMPVLTVILLLSIAAILLLSAVEKYNAS